MKNISSRILIVAILSGIAIILISFFKTSLELEDAEQAYYSQWFKWGYDDQPPLYTWIQILFNKLFGLSRFSLAGLRAICFAGTLWVGYQFAKTQVKPSLAQLAVLSWVLIPVFIDFNFRRLSHTNLMCLVVLATLWIIAKLYEQQHLKWYVLFGVALAVGMLTKYNYMLFVGALVILVAVDKNSRRIVFSWRILLSLAICILLITPHFWWLFSNFENVEAIQTSVAEKAQASQSIVPILSPTWALLKGFLNMLLPLLLLFSIGLVFKKWRWVRMHSLTWLDKLYLAQITILFIAFAVLEVHKVERRWLLPLMLPYVLVLLKRIEFQHTDRVMRIAFWMFCTAIIVQTVRTPVERMLRIDSAVHHSFEPLRAKLSAVAPEQQWVLPDVTYAGSVRFLQPTKEVFFWKDYTVETKAIDSAKAVFVTKSTERPPTHFFKIDSLSTFGYRSDTLVFWRKTAAE